MYIRLMRERNLRIKPKPIIYASLIFMLVRGTLIDDFGMPNIVRYVLDIGVIILALFMSKKVICTFQKIKFMPVFIIFVFFILSCIIGVVLNLVPLNLIVWSFRNNFRFYIFFAACICFLDIYDVDRIFNIMYVLQWINLVMAGYQYLVLGLKQDFLGGIFGHGGGAELTHFSCLLLAISFCRYIVKKIKFSRLCFLIMSTFLINTLAEQKIFYVQFIIVLGLTVLLSRTNFNKIKLFVFGISGIVVGLLLLKVVFPLQYDILTNADKVNDYMYMQGGGYNISRFGAFKEITELFFKDDLLKLLFGFGSGNCEYSIFPIFNSSFFEEYGYLNFRWFTHQTLFLENGYIGVFLFVIMYGANACYALKRLYRCEEDDYREYYITSFIITVICIISIWMNALLRNDSAYFAYYSMAIAGIVAKQQINKREE